jgi:predicted 2-oxoglutarate/Fe(II)-dependent dioxygenase YbiX
MPNAGIFAGLGFFVRRGFLDAEACAQIRREMSSAARIPAKVRRINETDGAVDEMLRRTDAVQLSPATTAFVESRLLALKPALEEHFKVELSGCQGSQFYIYEEGDFFVPHQDRATDDEVAPEHFKVRQISVSVFLNDGTHAGDGESYRGGALVFYGRRGDRDAPSSGVPLESETGMFVAFRSDWLHEVRPVASGRRYSIVTWFF